mgnify:CR=1 FL=1
MVPAAGYGSWRTVGELVDQIEETVSRHGMSKEDGRVRVMSIQWLSRNRKSMDEEPDLIVIDEAHHALAETYRDTLGELSGGKETGHDRHSLPAERQEIHGLVRQSDHFVDCRGIHRKGLVVIL